MDEGVGRVRGNHPDARKPPLIGVRVAGNGGTVASMDKYRSILDDKLRPDSSFRTVVGALRVLIGDALASFPSKRYTKLTNK